MRHAWLGLLLSCGAPMTPPEPPVPCPVSLRPGTVSLDGGFEPLDDGHALVVDPGPQGGFHVYVAAEVDGLERTGSLVWTLTSDTGVTLARRSLEVAGLQLDETACGWRRRRDLLIFERNDDVNPARGVPATLTVTLQERTASRRVVPR
jgi:hypothetical protein